jgi:hypothetical protein
MSQSHDMNEHLVTGAAKGELEEYGEGTPPKIQITTVPPSGILPQRAA